MKVAESMTEREFPKLGYGREDAAIALGVSPATVDRLVKRGLLRPSRATRRVIFALGELERFLQDTSAVVGQTR